MTIQDEKVVSLTYTLRVDGEIRDQATEEQPLEFIFGLGYLLPKFEEYLLGKEVGDTFEFVLSPEEGYGVYNEQAVVELPKHIFVIDGQLQEQLLEVGKVIPMMNQAGGVIPGKVVAVADETVTMDFNPDLAGKELHFTGKITAIRDATEKELTDGLHGERAAKGCNGNCGSCNSNCSSDEGGCN